MISTHTHTNTHTLSIIIRYFFQFCKDNGIHITVHAGEAGDSQEVDDVRFSNIQECQRRILVDIELISKLM